MNKTIGRPKRTEGRETKRDILKVAVELFAQKGFDATSVREIAREVGITQSALYIHFENKQHIFDELLSQYGPEAGMQILDRYTADFGKDIPSPLILKHIIAELMELFSIREAILLKEILLRSGKAEHIQLLKSRITLLKKRVEKILAIWMKHGCLRDDFPVEVVSWDLMAIVPAMRILFQTHDASKKQLEEAKKIALAHVDFFIARNFI